MKSLLSVFWGKYLLKLPRKSCGLWGSVPGAAELLPWLLFSLPGGEAEGGEVKQGAWGLPLSVQYLTDHCQVIQPSGKSNLGSKQYIWGVFLASASLCGCHQPFSSHLRKAAEVAAGLLHAPPPEAASAKEVPCAVTAHGQSWSDRSGSVH